MPCTVVRCITRSPTCSGGACVPSEASCATAALSLMMKSPACHCNAMQKEGEEGWMGWWAGQGWLSTHGAVC